MTTDDITRLHNAIDALQADLADRDKEIEELRAALADRDIDELTGAYNLRWLREFWSNLPNPTQIFGAVAFVDIDMLKRVNDTYGHKVGNRVITHVAAVLMASGCHVVRYGGDEFLLLIPAGWHIERTLKAIIADVGAYPIPTRDEPITVVVSCGARMTQDGVDLRRLIHSADEAMYEVKRARMGSVAVRVV